MGGGGAGRGWGARPPSHVAYYVALGGVVLLLTLLLMYCLYYCCSKVKELKDEELSAVPSATPRQYPVQQGVREGAQAMAKICRHLPPNVRSNVTAVSESRDLASPSTAETSVSSNATSKTNEVATSGHRDVNDTDTSQTDVLPSSRDVIAASKATLDSSVTSPSSFVLPPDANFVSKTSKTKSTQDSITNVTSLMTSDNSLSLSTAVIGGSDISVTSGNVRTETSENDVAAAGESMFGDDDRKLLRESCK